MVPVIHEGTLHYFEQLYSDFLVLFKYLYSPQETISPKMHFLVHFATIVRNNSPVRTYWAMNFEIMNGKVKKPTHVMNNFRNPMFTLAYKHQCAALELKLSSNYLRNTVEVSSVIHTHVNEYPTNDFEPYLTFPDQAEVAISSYITVNGTNYKKGNFVIVGKDGPNFVFGKIDLIVFECVDMPVLHLIIYITKHLPLRRASET